MARTSTIARSPSKRPPPPDQHERQRITTELDRCLVVEAAAGTGKTTSMVARLVALLEAGGATIENIAAVTFTRKAAAELRERFEVELKRRAELAEKPGVRQRLAAAAERIDRAFVGTIHSFCARLLRERPVEAGVDVGFAELDEPADQELRQLAWEELLAELYAAADPILDELARLGLAPGDLQSSFQRFADFPDIPEWPVPAKATYDLEPVRSALCAYVAHMAGLADELPVESGTNALIQKYHRLPRLLRHTDLSRPAALMELLMEFKEVSVTNKYWPGGEEQREVEEARWKRFIERVAEPALTWWREQRYEPVLRLFRRGAGLYDRLRSQAGGLNFQDLLLCAAALLRDSPHVRDYFRRRYTHLLVDEFQDTDPVQAEVMLLLTADDPRETEWQKCRPRPGSLFVVGDPKQSIYRFRRADIVTYNQVKRIVERTGGAVVNLSANFRTTDGLIEWVNDTFRRKFPPQATDEAPAYCPMLVGRTGEVPGQLDGLFVLDASADSSKADELVEAEADSIARFIRQALDEGWTVTRSAREQQQGLSGRVTAADFLIVTRNTKRMSLYGRKLDALGIPYQMTGGSALADAAEVRLLYVLLRALVHPDDPVALVAALRSELFGVSDPALYAFRRRGRRFDYRVEIPDCLEAGDRDAFADAFALLQKGAEWLRRLPAATAVERLIAASGLAVRPFLARGGAARSGALLKALELVRAAAADCASPAELVEYLGELAAAIEKYDALPVVVDDCPRVRIMNLHKVKGLEAPIVFLADPTGDSDYPPLLHVDRSGPVPRGYLAIGNGRRGNTLAHPADWQALVQRESGFEQAEVDRLMYVAATRAGCMLVVSRRSKRQNENPWEYFAEHVGEDEAKPLDVPPTSPTGAVTVPLDVGDWQAAAAAIDQGWAQARRPSYQTIAAKKLGIDTAAPVGPRVKRVGTLQPSPLVGEGWGGGPSYGPTPPPPLPSPIEGEGISSPIEGEGISSPVKGEGIPSPIEPEGGAAWGSVIHRLLEVAMLDPNTDLHELAAASLLEEGLDPAQAAGAVSMAQVVIRSDIWRRAQASPRRLVEVPFQTLRTGDDAPAGIPTIVKGVIDLVFETPQGWVIVDYKTDLIPVQGVRPLVDYYRGQVRTYKETWEKDFGQTVFEVGLFFLSANRYVTLCDP